MLIFEMLIVQFQVLLMLNKIHSLCVQRITEILLYFGDICSFLIWVSVPLSKTNKKKCCIIVAVKNNIYPYDTYASCRIYQY